MTIDWKTLYEDMLSNGCPPEPRDKCIPTTKNCGACWGKYIEGLVLDEWRGQGKAVKHD